MLTELIFIILLTLTGELIVALPVALVIGLDPIFSLILVVTVNIIPAYPIFKLFEKLYKKENRIIMFLLKRGEYLRRKAKKGLDLAVLIFTPIAGVYATSLFLALIKFPIKKGILLQVVSLLFYGLVIIFGYYFLNMVFYI
jgi:hypothetical protein